MDKLTYTQSGVCVSTLDASTSNASISDASTSDIHNNHTYILPIMFNPHKLQEENQLNALHWLNINYSRVLNCSPSNDFLYIYFLVDAYIVSVLNKENIPNDLRLLYETYINIILTTKRNGQDERSIIDQ